jgi:hypothetical protein
MSVTLNAYSGMQAAVRTWRQHRERARLHAERRKIHAAVDKNFAKLCDLKCQALKTTGVFRTEHENLEQAIVFLAYAREDYRDEP